MSPPDFAAEPSRSQSNIVTRLTAEGVATPQNTPYCGLIMLEIDAIDPV